MVSLSRVVAGKLAPHAGFPSISVSDSGVAIFRRRDAGSSVHPIGEFWSWWASTGNSINPHRQSRATDELTLRVAAIHPDLRWHFGPGDRSEHTLTVSAGGVAEVRPMAERWLRDAPAPNDTWEFRSSQQADPTAMSNVLEIAGHSVDLSLTEFRVEPADQELRVQVGVYHPAFVDLPEEVRAQVTFLVLDWLVGEDDVERWLGHLEPLTVRPMPPGSAEDVTSAVARIALRRDPEGWTLAQWTDREGAPGLAMFRRGLRWIDTPTLDRHQIISAEYPAKPNGLPESLDGVRDIEAELESLLDSRGILVGHETHHGVRTFHAYIDSEDQNLGAALRDWATRRSLSLESRPDASWHEVRQFTG
jgi:hypothetical protein